MAGAALALALGSAALWGTADYLGGIGARRMHALAVTLWSQSVGLVLAGTLALALGASVPADAVWWALAAGASGAVGLAFFYAALGAGAMSVVAPLSACGAVVPVVVALAGGESPGVLGGVGMVVALGGAVIVSIGAEAGEATRLSRRALSLAVAAAVGIGAVLALMQQAAEVPGADGLGVVAVMRISGVGLLVVLALASRPGVRLSGPARWPVLATGLFDTSANLCFVLASAEGDEHAVVAVLGSLYPVTTVILATTLLHERPTRGQRGGIALALLGIALIAAR